MLPIHKASVQGLGLDRPVYRRSSNNPASFQSSASPPQNNGPFGLNIGNRWLRLSVGTLKKPKLWYAVMVLLGLMWLAVSVIYLPALLIEDISTNTSGGPGIPSGNKGQLMINRESVGHEIDTALDNFLTDVNMKFTSMDNPDVREIWSIYRNLAELHLLPLDRRTKRNKGLFPVLENKSIFVSIVSYGNDNCCELLKDIYSNALHPEKVTVGLVEENVKSNDDDSTSSDSNCYNSFCNTDLGKPYCKKKAIRVLQVDEKDSLGLSVDRYLAAKLWRGENFFFQLDSNSFLLTKWDESLIKDISETPTYPKSVLSYNPLTFSEDKDLNSISEQFVPVRICSAQYPKEQFPLSGVDGDIIQLNVNKAENSAQKRSYDGKPCPTAFLISGFIFAHGNMLSTLPFDPFVPWLSMGEETLLSLRMWTWGFNFYGPTKSVAGYYLAFPPRAKHRKFWETPGHLLEDTKDLYYKFSCGVVLRVEHLLYNPQASKAIIDISDLPSVLIHQDELYGEGHTRDIRKFFSVVGIDPLGRETKEATWCMDCTKPSNGEMVK